MSKVKVEITLMSTLISNLVVKIIALTFLGHNQICTNSSFSRKHMEFGYTNFDSAYHFVDICLSM